MNEYLLRQNPLSNFESETALSASCILTIRVGRLRPPYSKDKFQRQASSRQLKDDALIMRSHITCVKHKNIALISSNNPLRVIHDYTFQKNPPILDLRNHNQSIIKNHTRLPNIPQHRAPKHANPPSLPQVPRPSSLTNHIRTLSKTQTRPQIELLSLPFHDMDLDSDTNLDRSLLASSPSRMGSVLVLLHRSENTALGFSPA